MPSRVNRSISRALLTALALLATGGMSLESRSQTPDPAAEEHRCRGYVRQCLDTLIKHGRDRYGPVQTPIFMSIIDVRTLESPEVPELYDGLVRTEGRRHRRAEGGANLWNDQATLRAMYKMSELTGDDKYSEAADAYIKSYTQRAAKTDGLLIWGSHSFYNCYTDEPDGQQFRDDPRYPDPLIKIGTFVHETLIRHPQWEQMNRVAPDAVRKEIDGIWVWHIVDKTTGVSNRHDDMGGPDHAVQGDYGYSSGSFALAFSYMYHATGEWHWLDKARIVAEWHWRNRHPQTSLIAQAPASASIGYNGRHCMTSEVGPYAAQLLHCYEYTRDPFFRQAATTYIKAYDRHAWDESKGTYYAMLRLDGRPVTDIEQIGRDERNQWIPLGHVNVWRTTVFPFEFPVIAAQSSVYAWELSDEDPAKRDPELLRIAERWAKVIKDALPPQPGHRQADSDLIDAMPALKETGGTYAENYGRAISFFVHLYRATGNEEYLRTAETLADETIEKLWDNGLFKGHPAKPYYDALDGVGLLLLALLDLDEPNQPMDAAF